MGNLEGDPAEALQGRMYLILPEFYSALAFCLQVAATVCFVDSPEFHPREIIAPWAPNAVGAPMQLHKGRLK